MTRSQPVLQVYGAVHALSSRGLHVRQSARSWKLILPLSAQLVAAVRGLCEGMARADAVRLLGLLDRFAQSDVAVCSPELLSETADMSASRGQDACC